MIIIGEKLNSSIPKTLEAMKNKDEAALIHLIQKQEQCGADYLDINTAICGEEEELTQLLWIIDLVKQHSSCGIMLDSPSPAVVTYAMERLEGRKVIINSVTLTQRIEELLPIIKQTHCGVVGLPIDDSGIPASSEQRYQNALKLVERLQGEGIEPCNIYIDALVEALAVGSDNANITLDTIKKVRQIHPDLHITCGLSNVSFGLPKRSFINTSFLAMALQCGLDSPIMDITSPAMRSALVSSLAVLGVDEYCMEYISFIREQQ